MGGGGRDGLGDLLGDLLLVSAVVSWAVKREMNKVLTIYTKKCFRCYT